MTRDQRTLAWRLIILPLLLLVLALWQGHRADTTRTEALQAQAELGRFISDMARLEVENSRQQITIGEREYSPALAHALAQRKLSQVDREVTVARIGGWLPGFSKGFAGLLLLIGVASLLALRWAARSALGSRDRLVQLFHIGRQVLPTLLVASMLLLTITVVLEIAYEALWLFTLDQGSSGVMKLQLLVGAVILIMLWPLYRLPGQLKVMMQLFDREPHDIFGTALTEQQAPALWARVRQLAQRLDALAPDHIVIGYLDGFYVTSSDVELSPGATRLQGRTLYVPLPLLAMLSRSESDAVIAHELAHFSGQDTDYSMRFMPIYESAWRSMGVLGERMQGGLLQSLLTMPAYGLAFHFMQCFDHAVSYWSRSRELLADAAGARLGGAQSVVDSLVRLSVLESAVDEYLSSQCQDPEAWPDDVLAMLLAHLAAQPLQLPDGELDEQLPHPTDTHPPTIQRIQALGLSLEAVHRGAGLRPVIPAQAMACIRQDLPDVTQLSRQLSAALGERLVEHRAEVRQDLQARAEAASSRTVVHEGAQVRGRIVLAFSAAFVIGGLWVLLMPHSAAAKPALITFFTIMGTTLLAIGVLFGVLGWRLIKRAATPAMILDAQTVTFANAPEPLALHLIDGYHMRVGSGMAVVLKLADDAPLPVFYKRRFMAPDAKFDPKRRLIILTLARWSIDGKALDAKALAELVARYLEGGHARHVLASFDEPPVAARVPADLGN